MKYLHSHVGLLLTSLFYEQFYNLNNFVGDNNNNNNNNNNDNNKDMQLVKHLKSILEKIIELLYT